MPVEQTETFSPHSVHAHMDGIVKIRCDGLAPPRITGEKHIAAHVPLNTANVKLLADILHNDCSLP